MDKWKKNLVRCLFHYSACNLQTEHAFYIKNLHIPQRLYKYRKFSDQHKRALENGILYRCSPDKFNDPYDTAVYFNVDRLLMEDRSLEEAVQAAEVATVEATPYSPKPIQEPIRFGNWRKKALEETLAHAPDEFRSIPNLSAAIEKASQLENERMMTRLSEHFRSGFGVISLSEVPSSILMWSHYSNNHAGFCIEYDFSTMPPEDLRRRFCFPVYYRGKLTDATRYLAKADPATINFSFGQYLCLLKSDVWRYEKEWRIVFPTGHTHANAEILMPTPSAIILGARVKSENEQWMKGYCNHNSIPLKKMQQRRNSFKLDIVSNGE